MARLIYDVKSRKGNWEVRRRGRSRANFIGASREQVLQRVHEMVKDKTALVAIFNEEGGLLEERNYPYVAETVEVTEQ